MSSQHAATREFEAAVAAYTGAPYVVAVNSCTMALLLSLGWHFWGKDGATGYPMHYHHEREIEIPKRTYVGVPMSIIRAGGWPTFRNGVWSGMYQLKPLPVWDSARWFTSGIFNYMTAGEVEWRRTANKVGKMVCVSFHWTKTLGVEFEQGGAILHDDPEADAWLRRARFDGRTEGVAPKDDTFTQIGWHCYMNPTTAQRLLKKMQFLERHNEPLPNDDYPDLSLHKAFQ